ARFEDTDLALLDAARDVIDARAGLAVLLGVPVDGPWSVPAVVPAPEGAEPALEGMIATAEARRLDLAAARETVAEKLEALETAAGWRLWQSIAVGVGVERQTDGRWSMGPNLDIALPLFDAGGPRVARAAAEVLKAQNDLAA